MAEPPNGSGDRITNRELRDHIDDLAEKMEVRQRELADKVTVRLTEVNTEIITMRGKQDRIEADVAKSDGRFVKLEDGLASLAATVSLLVNRPVLISPERVVVAERIITWWITYEDWLYALVRWWQGRSAFYKQLPGILIGIAGTLIVGLVITVFIHVVYGK